MVFQFCLDKALEKHKLVVQTINDNSVIAERHYKAVAWVNEFIRNKVQSRC